MNSTIIPNPHRPGRIGSRRPWHDPRSGCRYAFQTSRRLNVQTVRVKKGVATRSVTLPARIAPIQQATLYAKVTGYFKTVTVDKGDGVKPASCWPRSKCPN